MTYRELQQCLKTLRDNGYTTIRLNQKKDELQAEYNRCQEQIAAERKAKRDRTTGIQVRRIQLSDNGWTWNQLSPRVATITTPDGDRQCAYFGFCNHDSAFNFFKYLTDRGLCRRAKVRPSKRIRGWAWEVKVWGASTETIRQLVKRDLARCKGNRNAPQFQQSPATYSAIKAEAIA
jgi:hypothetical protein